MNENFTPEIFGENHITEIKEESAKKTKKKKSGFSFVTFFVTLIICIAVSTLSGAGGAFFVYTFLTPSVTEQSTTEADEFVIEEITTALSVNTEIATDETVTEEMTAEEENTFMPVIQNEPETEEQTAAQPVTEAPKLTKGEIYSNAVNSIVTIEASWKQYYSSFLGSYYRPASSSGTGFVVTQNGYIITNYHVIENAEELTVTDYNGNEYSAKVIGSEPENDVAVIKIEAETVPVQLGLSSSLNVGDDILIIGNALGELSYTYTDGIVSHLSRSVTLESGETINMFQTNAAINNGNSGGPVYNMDGEVVGIASAKYASEKIEGLGFCIPIDDVKDMITDIILYGYVTGKPLLGITVQTVTSSMASRYSLPTGCYIVALDTYSAAYQAGLRNGDVITKIGSKTISSCEDLESVLSSKKAGDNLNITYYRDGTSGSVNLSLHEYKPSEPRTNYSNVYDY